MSRLAFLLSCLFLPAAALADDPLHANTQLVACSDLRRTASAHCFIVTPDQHWETIAHTGGLLLLRRLPPVAGEPPLFFRPAQMAPVTMPAVVLAPVPTAAPPAVVRPAGLPLDWLLPGLLLMGIGTLSSTVLRALWIGWRRRRRRMKAVDKVATEIAVQQRRLQVKRFQLVGADDYGTVDLRKWQLEKRYFCTTRLVPLLSAAGLADQWLLITKETDHRIEQAASQPAAEAPSQPFLSDPQRFDPRMHPIDYERHCAMLLFMSGWDAQLTAASGDQGADVLARRDGKLLVVQCKLYRSAVGNAAVQQVSAARLHQQANYAAVVSNARFTPQARQLARTNGVYLLHHEELRAFQPA